MDTPPRCQVVAPLGSGDRDSSEQSQEQADRGNADADRCQSNADRPQDQPTLTVGHLGTKVAAQLGQSGAKVATESGYRRVQVGAGHRLEMGRINYGHAETEGFEGVRDRGGGDSRSPPSRLPY